jgi:hypothetical protein
LWSTRRPRKQALSREREEMNDEALHYAMIGGRPEEKQNNQPIE